MPLPEALEFLHFGWWVIHLVAIYLIYSYAYRKGRRDERRSNDRGRAGGPAEKRPVEGNAARKP